MDHRGMLLLTSLLGVYTANECASFEPVCKGQSPEDYYNGFLVYLDLGYNNGKWWTRMLKASTVKNIDEKTVETIEKNTLCGIQTVCLSILQSSWQSVSPNKFDSLLEIPLDIMVILYNINTVLEPRVLYPLWLFHLYVKNIHVYALRLDFGQMFCVHQMIIEQLTLSTKVCPDGKKFAFSKRKKNRFDKIRRHLKRVTTANRSYERINADNLLGGYASVLEDHYDIDRIIRQFGSSGQWGNVSRVFSEAHYKATDPANLYTGLRGIAEFQTLFSGLLKMIMLRMVCIHLLLVTDDNRLESNGPMLELVSCFAVKTGLKDDETFVKTLKVLRDERPSPEDSNAVIDCIRSDLATSSTAFEGCDVSTIAEEDVPRIFDNVAGLEEFPSYIKKNLGLAANFVDKVKIWLLHVDQELIKSVLALAYPIDGNFDEDNLPSFCVNNVQY